MQRILRGNGEGRVAVPLYSCPQDLDVPELFAPEFVLSPVSLYRESTDTDNRENDEAHPSLRVNSADPLNASVSFAQKHVGPGMAEHL